MKVLSLFDGMACGMIAMNLAGVDVESYDAYEIDKYAVKTAQHNFPMIREHGDVFAADFTQYEGVDFMVGGSPWLLNLSVLPNAVDTSATTEGSNNISRPEMMARRTL